MTEDRPTLADSGRHRPFPTRWHDNDVVEHLNTTVRSAATGTFVHVFVDRTGRRPIAVPDRIRARTIAELSADAQ